jgi:hypothetical protein
MGNSQRDDRKLLYAAVKVIDDAERKKERMRIFTWSREVDGQCFHCISQT